jgi:tRNA-2-methylthio-N6-dimethylallyladenosine synthase
VGKTVEVLFQERGRREGQLIGKSPWLQSVHARAPERLIGRLVEVRVASGHANSLAGEVIAGLGVAA